MKYFDFKARTPRRIPDPTFPNSERHILLCSVDSLPEGLPKGANPRTQDDIDRGIYREVKQSLLNQECTPNSFHLKNKGITIIASNVEKNDDESLRVNFSSEDQGIVDGAHTYELILRNRDEINRNNNLVEDWIKQFVKVEILTGIPDALVTEIAGGLNTAVQVQRMSLAELGKEFDWIKAELEGTDFLHSIAFMQNEQKDYDARDVLRWLHLFNVYEFPNEGSSYPIQAYTSKESVLKHYLDKKGGFKKNYEKLTPILRDILKLHDMISSEAYQLYNEGGGKRGGRLKFMESGKKKFSFPFIKQESDYRLSGGALYPMLGAFRAFVEEDSLTGNAKWKGSFTDVLATWRTLGKELMEATQETSEELGRNPNAIGKSKKHWAYLHNMVLRQLG